MLTTMSTAGPTLRKILFCLAIFVAAFMSFLIEPLIGKLATPKLGSAAAVWGVILMFFQIALLMGYLITYALSKLPGKQQVGIYILLLCTSLFFLRFPSTAEWQSINLSDPTIGLVAVLFASIGIPVVLLYTVSGTIQHYCGVTGWRNPYVLFSLSNLACVSALLTYPFLVEPNFSLSTTCTAWTYGCGAALLLSCLAAGSVWGIVQSGTNDEETEDQKIIPNDLEQEAELKKSNALSSFSSLVSCATLSALGCITLIAYTAYVTADVAPVPLLWIIPLCIYLSTFIICFKDSNYYNRALFALLAPTLWLIEPLFKSNAMLDVLVVMAVVLTFCMIFHGELALKKPHHKHLTAYYLAIAVGGAIGGIFENFIAPAIFSSNTEIGLLGLFVLVLSGINLHRRASSIKKAWVTIAYSGLTLVLSLGVGSIFYVRFLSPPDAISLSRNFYGCLKVARSKFPDGSTRILLVHGSTTHGSQFTDEARKDTPTTYYSRTTACGSVFPALQKIHAHAGINVGVIGLGAGTLACYGEASDKITFYEIDERVEAIARKYFSYLQRSHAKSKVIIGDARKSLEQEEDQKYDLLIVDAFSGDSVPTHLLTKEGFQSYCRHLKADGVLMFHCSNRYLNLPAVIANVANTFSLPSLLVEGKEAIYTVVCKQHSTEEQIKASIKETNPDLMVSRITPEKRYGIWTDDYVSLLPVLKYDEK